MVEDERVAHEGLVLMIGQCFGLFYENGGMLGSRDPEWFQGTLNALIGLFRRYILAGDVSKSKAMTCHPGEIWIGMSEEAVVRLCAGRRDTYR